MTNSEPVKGQIIRALSGFYDVRLADGTIERTRARGQFRKTKQTPLVGDWVMIHTEQENEGVLTEILPRRNAMQRPPVANVDRALVVVSVTYPEIPLKLVDRLLVYAESLDIQPLLYLTKWDLLPDQAAVEVAQAQFQPYEAIGYPVLTGDVSKVAVDVLMPYIEDQTVVVMGQSGVGKTTLLNQLLPDKELATGEISQALGRGRHTTRHVEIHPALKGQVIDTPGFSSLELAQIAPDQLAQYFPEIWAKQPECKFRGCRHLKEPHCAVKEAVQAGIITQARYDHYVAFFEEINAHYSTY
ncbi:MAG: ribosome small subunit-dependent GTPase A [Aerococcus sp.]|nr:ribosome small subunit-dependent GTPase A [Aerococcus sp.]